MTYEKSLERAKEYYNDKNCMEHIKSILEYIFPELKESEDERISRKITEFILTHRIDEPNDIEDTNSWLAWLEMQGKNFPVLSNSLNIGKDLQVDGFDAELNTLLKRYEHLPKEEVAECLSFYLGVIQGEQKLKWSEFHH